MPIEVMGAVSLLASVVPLIGHSNIKSTQAQHLKVKTLAIHLPRG